MAFASIFKAGIPKGFYIKIMLLPLSFLILAVLTIAFVRVTGGEDIIFKINVLGYSIGITFESLKMAGKLFLKSLGAVSCLYFLSLTTPIIQLISVLKKLKLPVIIVELMSLIYKFIFVLVETANKIYISQDSRLGYSSVKIGYFSLGKLISSLFIQSMNRSKALYTSLESRGYNGELTVLEQEYQTSYFKIISVILAGLVLATLSLIPGVL
jgi:cobalt/nickel transport system permease protein